MELTAQQSQALLLQYEAISPPTQNSPNSSIESCIQYTCKFYSGMKPISHISRNHPFSISISPMAIVIPMQSIAPPRNCQSLRQSTDETQPFLSLSTEHNDFPALEPPKLQEACRETQAPPISPQVTELWKRVYYKVRLEAMLRRVAKELVEPSPLLEPEAHFEPKKTCPFPTFPPTSLPVRGWGGIYLALLTYTFLVVPFNFVFLDSEAYSPWIYVNSLVDLLFACDILIRLNTGFYDQSHKLVTSHIELFTRYGLIWLLFDLFATIPFHLISGRLSRVNRLFRLFRIKKLFHISQKSRSFDLVDTFDVKLSTVRFGSFIAATLLASHIFACFWSLIAILEVENPENWISTYHKEDLSSTELYLEALLWTLQTLSTCGFGDMVPCTSCERVAATLWMLFAVLFLSYTIRSLSSVLDPQNSKENILIRKQAVIEEFSSEAQISIELRRQLRYAISQKVENSDSLQFEVFSAFQELPEDLRYEVAQVIHRGALKNLRFFNARDKSFVVDVFPLLKHRSVPKGFTVYEVGQTPEHVFFILAGVCVVVTKGMDVIKKLRDGAYFGDVEIFSSRARLHTVKAATDCEFLTMNRPLLSLLKKKYPEIRKQMEATAKDKEKAWVQSSLQIIQLKHQLQLHRQPSMQERLTDVRERRRSSTASIHLKPIDAFQFQVSLLEARMQMVSSALKELKQLFGDIAVCVGAEAESPSSVASSHWSEHDIYSGYSTPEEH